MSPLDLMLAGVGIEYDGGSRDDINPSKPHRKCTKELPEDCEVDVKQAGTWKKAARGVSDGQAL